MFFLNVIKKIINIEVLIIFLAISYILIFVNSKELKKNNYHKDLKIVRTMGIVYSIASIILLAVITYR